MQSKISNPSTHQPINPSAIHPSTHQLINSSTHQLINPSTHQQHINVLKMDQTTKWYSISLALFTATLLLYRIGTVASNFFVAEFQVWALKRIIYPLLVQRRYFASVTRFQGAVVGSYFIINGVCMGIGIKSTSDLLLRSGTMASINMMPLFLGGRTSVLANFLGISLHTYYLAHHWIGRLVVIQSLLHVSLVIASGKPWTYDSFQIAGISVGSKHIQQAQEPRS